VSPACVHEHVGDVPRGRRMRRHETVPVRGNAVKEREGVIDQCVQVRLLLAPLPGRGRRLLSELADELPEGILFFAAAPGQHPLQTVSGIEIGMLRPVRERLAQFLRRLVPHPVGLALRPDEDEETEDHDAEGHPGKATDCGVLLADGDDHGNHSPGRRDRRSRCHRRAAPSRLARRRAPVFPTFIESGAPRTSIRCDPSRVAPFLYAAGPLPFPPCPSRLHNRIVTGYYTGRCPAPP